MASKAPCVLSSASLSRLTADYFAPQAPKLAFPWSLNVPCTFLPLSLHTCSSFLSPKSIPLPSTQAST